MKELFPLIKKGGGGSDFPHKKGGADKIRVFAL